MEYGKALTKYIRVSPRKARLAADLIRRQPVPEAFLQLDHCQMRAGRLLKKTLTSAVANAESQHDVRKENLQVLEVRVDEGPRLQRSKSRSRGSRAPIIKRTSHFTIGVGSE